MQDAWIRAQAATEPIESPAGLLTTIVTRLCLDRLRAARTTRETYVGAWLPEPVQTLDPEATADESLVRAESVSMAFLRILQQLSPLERAVFLLKEVFEYRHEAISSVLGVTLANSRQILRRAREHVAGGEARFESEPETQRRVVEAFLGAAMSGDPKRVVEVLHPDVEWTSDGGGVVSAATRTLIGHDRVVAFVLGLIRKAPDGARVEVSQINESAAILVYLDDALDTVIGFDVRDERIVRIWAIRNPEKLHYLAGQLGRIGRGSSSSVLRTTDTRHYDK